MSPAQTTAEPKGPFILVTVNTAPERAYRLVGRMCESLKDRYDIRHVGNCERIEDVKSTIESFNPDVLFCASMFTKSQSESIKQTAREVNPDVRFYAIPHGMQVDKGPDFVVEHLIENVPSLLAS